MKLSLLHLLRVLSDTLEQTNLNGETTMYCLLPVFSLRKTVGKVSAILVTLTSRSDSDFESLNVSLKENKPVGVNPNSNDILWFSADCIVAHFLRHPVVSAG